MKKNLKILLVILFCSLFMIFMSNSNVSARYDRNSNTANIAVSKNKVVITVRYQRGLDKGTAVYAWCEKDTPGTVVDGMDKCMLVNGVSEINYIEKGGDYNLNYIAQGDADYVDSNIVTRTFEVSASKDSVLKDVVSATPDKHYALVVTHYFCSVRNIPQSGEYVSCVHSDLDNKYTVLDVSSNDIMNDKVVGGTGGSMDEIDDDNIRTMMEKVYDVVHGTVMPIIWFVLGLFLVIKGSLLGVQIVKSADEPQVRQEKIGSLKWLVIGVGIAYASSFVVDLVIGFFSNAFN